jgi:geranylgeranyl transferase type-1 subunit beta
MTDTEEKKLPARLQVAFFERHLMMLPDAYSALDTSRLTVMYFALSALDLLGAVDGYPQERKTQLVDFIYALQVLPSDQDVRRCGFRGSPHAGPDSMDNSFIEGHIAQTYTALSMLSILGDDLSRVDKKAVIGALQHLQTSSGGFASTFSGGEADLRFLYCACAISSMLNDWSGFDVKLAEQFVLACQTREGSFSLRPGNEGHGGSTYCAIACLSLLGRLDAMPNRRGVLKWCALAQGEGFCGRPNKPPDTCYSFWVGATMKILGVYGWTNVSGNRAFNFSCQTLRGGFGKHPDCHPDILHSYFGLAGLSFMGEDNLKPLDPILGISDAAKARTFPHLV